MKKVANKPTVKKSSKATTTKKKTVTKKNVSKITFNKYSMYFQTASILFLVAAFSLHLCCYISINAMLDLFGIAVFLLAFSLFPERSKN